MKTSDITSRTWVIAIIALSACVLTTALVFIARDNGRAAKAREDVRLIHQAALQFKAKTGQWPTSVYEMLEGCGYHGDPWGNDYQLVVKGDHLSVVCLGRDNRPGGHGEDADIVLDSKAP